MGRLLVGILIGLVFGALGHAWLATPATPVAVGKTIPDPPAPAPAALVPTKFDPASIAATPADIAAASSETVEAKVEDAPLPDRPKPPPFLTDAYSRAIAEDRAHPRSPSQWDDDFNEEPRDGSWAASAEHRLSAFFGNVQSRGVTLMGVQCRQTLCEMKLTEPLGVPDQFHNVVDDWHHNGGSFGNLQWTMTGGDNGQRYIVAIVRKWPRP